jgi:hypothetical protein
MSVNYWVIASGLADPADLAQGPWERLNGAPRSGKWLPGALRSGGVGSGKGRGRRGSSEGEDGHEHPTSLEPGQAAPVGTGRPDGDDEGGHPDHDADLPRHADHC